MFCVTLKNAITLTYLQVPCDPSSTLLVLTPDELAQRSPFYLDNDSAVAIAGAMLMIMAVAFLLRMVRKSLETL